MKFNVLAAMIPEHNPLCFVIRLAGERAFLIVAFVLQPALHTLFLVIAQLKEEPAAMRHCIS